MKELFKSLYLSPRFFIFVAGAAFIFLLGFFFQLIFIPAIFLFFAFLSICILDMILLYRQKIGITASRNTPDRLSNGDENVIEISLSSNYLISLNIEIIDEIPALFQKRDFLIVTELAPNQRKVLDYRLRPVERGEYKFGYLNIFASSKIGFIKRV